MSKLDLIGFMPLVSADAFKSVGYMIGNRQAKIVRYIDMAAILLPHKNPSLFASRRKKLIAKIEAFQKSLETLSAFGKIIPAVYGTMFDDEAQVLGFMAANNVEITALINEYGAARQFQIDVSWDIKCALEYYKNHEHMRISTNADVVPAMQEGLEKIRTELDHEIDFLLDASCLETISMPRADDTIVALKVVLINGEDEASLDAAVEKIDAINTELFNIKYRGPLPACSFASIEKLSVKNSDIDKARVLLGVEGNPTPETLASAYRQYMKNNHPDLGGSAEAVAQGVEANELLGKISKSDLELNKLGLDAGKNLQIMNVRREGEARKAA